MSMKAFRVLVRSDGAPLKCSEFVVISNSTAEAVAMVDRKFHNSLPAVEITDVRLMDSEVLIEPHSFARGE